MSDIIPPRSDLLFQAIFGDERHREILVSFLKAVLDLPDDDLAPVKILNTSLPVEHNSDKRSILDVCVETASGRRINIEVQLDVRRDLPERIVYYHSKMVAQQIKSGSNYAKLNQSVTIVILGEPLFPGGTGYHHRYCFAEPETGTVLTRISLIDTLELTKVPKTADGSELWKWMSFIGADDEEELDMAALLDPVIGEAVTLVKRFSASEEFRLRQLLYEKSLSDQAHDLDEAKREGWEEGRVEGEARGLAKGLEEGLRKARELGIRAALDRGLPLDDVVAIFDLSPEEAARLAPTDGSPSR